MTEFYASQQMKNGVSVISLSGRFDAHTIDEVQPLLEAATSKSPAQVLVDLSGAGFIDSSALSALVGGMKRARQQGGDLVICALPQPVRIIFELTRLDKVFTITDDHQAGMVAFAAADQAALLIE